jgi:hypothetical protein
MRHPRPADHLLVVAGILGPVLVNYIREYQISNGVPKAQAYNVTMYVMAGLLVIGFFCNLFIKEVHEKHHMGEADAQWAALQEKAS